MIGPRTAVGLSLLCALAFCAFAAQSASAQTSNNTTAVTCVQGGGDEDFSDAHCDNKVAAGTGSFGHVAIANNTTTDVTTTNETTGGAKSNAVLKGKAFGAAIEISCTTLHGEGTLRNTEPTSKQHTVTGTGTSHFSGCTVLKPLKCEVAEPIVIEAEFHGVDKTGPNSDTMGGEVYPDGGGSTFVELGFKHKGAGPCALNGQKLPVTGSAVATGTPAPTEKHSGATASYTDAMTTETLSFAGNAAGLDAITTAKRIGGNPIAVTTTT